MAKNKALRVDHGPIDEDVLDTLTDDEKQWLLNWNRGDEIPNGDEDADADEDDSEEDDATDYDSWTNDQLRAELESRELPTSGNKAELIERLQEDDDSEE